MAAGNTAGAGSRGARGAGQRRSALMIGVAAVAVLLGTLYLGLGVGTKLTATVDVPTEPADRVPKVAAAAGDDARRRETAAAQHGPVVVRPGVGASASDVRPPDAPAGNDKAAEAPRLPNGGPGLLLEMPSWSEVRLRFVRAATVKEPIELIWDFAVLGACGPVATDVAGFEASGAGAAVPTTLAAALGRVRVAAVACVPPTVTLDAVTEALWKGAPAWRVRTFAAGARGEATVVSLERRQRLFVFAITGGNDGRAAYVERTWGRRTPTQWYGDRWDPLLRNIVDLHPKYLQDKFDLLTFKISRIWQRVFEDFGLAATKAAWPPALANAHPALRAVVGDAGGYDWFARLWDDNYFYEENLQPALSFFDPATPVMTGKMGWRNMGTKPSAPVVYPFAGGGAGWYLSRAGMELLGPSIAKAEAWFVEFRARRDIFLPHGIHDEDVFLSAWLSILNVSFKNIPGVEHVSPGRAGKQRCMDPDTLRKLRWDRNFTVFFDYPGREEVLRLPGDTWYAYFKPIIWHYMSPTRLVNLETTLYPERAADFAGESLPRTNSDVVKRGKPCYPGVPPGPPPARGVSLFERPVTDPPVVAEEAGHGAAAEPSTPS